jgi:hypothetical protein
MKSSCRKLSLAFRRSRRAAPTQGSLSAPPPNAATAPTCAFLLAPSEIRNAIYDLLFLHSTAPYRVTKPGLSTPSSYRRHIAPSSASPSPHAICLACRQTYAEAHALFYSLTVFNFSTLPNYTAVTAVLAAPPRHLAALAAHLSGIPLQPALTAGLGSFASLRSVYITLPQRIIIHTMLSSASSSIAAMRDAEIYAVLKGLEDSEAKQRRDLRRLLDAYPDVVFSCGVQVVCHESKAYSADPRYDSLRLVSHYAII